MRADGEVTYLFIEHKEAGGRWVESALGYFLFNEMSYSDKQDEVATDYRRLMEPQNTSSDLWQKYGINGYLKLEDAEAMLAALRQRCPDRKFRVVRRTIIQRTTLAVGP